MKPFSNTKFLLLGALSIMLVGCDSSGFAPPPLFNGFGSQAGAAGNGGNAGGSGAGGSNPTASPSSGSGSGSGSSSGSGPGSGSGTSSGSGPGTGSGSSGSTPTPSPSPSSDAANGQVPITYICSNQRTIDEGTNVVQASELELIVTDPSTNTIVCDVTNSIRDGVLNNKVVDLTGCPALSANTYNIQVRDPAKSDTDLFYDGHDYNNGIQTALTSVTVSRSSSSAPWTYQDTSTDTVNGKHPLYILYATAYYSNACSTGGAENASPLVVDVGSDRLGDQDLVLSSPSQGVLFDILGANSYPAPYTKKLISWIEQPLQYMFLTLPSADGTVGGINELFGNNTLGPDGNFAANGFAALAKYDSNGDGVIDSHDQIFSKLRLWSDVNKDGIAQPGELHTLSEMHIEKINLRYNRSFREKDQYGNLFKYASSVEKDGQERLIFDVWFAISQ